MQNTEYSETQDTGPEIRELSPTETDHISGGVIVAGSGVTLVNDGGTGGIHILES